MERDAKVTVAMNFPLVARAIHLTPLSLRICDSASRDPVEA